MGCLPSIDWYRISPPSTPDCPPKWIQMIGCWDGWWRLWVYHGLSPQKTHTSGSSDHRLPHSKFYRLIHLLRLVHDFSPGLASKKGSNNHTWILYVKVCSSAVTQCLECRDWGLGEHWGSHALQIPRDLQVECHRVPPRETSRCDSPKTEQSLSRIASLGIIIPRLFQRLENLPNLNIPARLAQRNLQAYAIVPDLLR